jgi:hypothetical protein
MARSRFNDPIEPLDLANMRANGVRSLDLQCKQCRHEVALNVDHLPGDLAIPSLVPRMACTKCGAVGADVRPNWKERQWQDVRLGNSVLAHRVFLDICRRQARPR